MKKNSNADVEHLVFSSLQSLVVLFLFSFPGLRTILCFPFFKTTTLELALASRTLQHLGGLQPPSLPPFTPVFPLHHHPTWDYVGTSHPLGSRSGENLSG